VSRCHNSRQLSLPTYAPGSSPLPSATSRRPGYVVAPGEVDGMARPPAIRSSAADDTRDVRYRYVKRVASTVGEGAIAVQLVHEYLGELDS
jgi:thioredoxin reductase